jgi:hypothetical protein
MKAFIQGAGNTNSASARSLGSFNDFALEMKDVMQCAIDGKAVTKPDAE